MTSALASDCGRFSCAAFQSVVTIAPDMEDRDAFAWALIKLYYAAFYAGHALIRTLGEGCSFFYKVHTDRIASVADATGMAPPFRVDSGLYHCVLESDASIATFTRTAAGSSGGSHEAFWFVFGNKMKATSEAILAGPLPRSDAQSVFIQIDQMLQILSRKGGIAGSVACEMISNTDCSIRHGIPNASDHNFVGTWPERPHFGRVTQCR